MTDGCEPPYVDARTVPLEEQQVSALNFGTTSPASFFLSTRIKGGTWLVEAARESGFQCQPQL